MSSSTDRQRLSAKTLRKCLGETLEQEHSTLRAAVADEALHHWSDDPAVFFRDLMRCGCQSGFIGSLIYYADTHAFLDRHYDEIEELRQEMEESLGEPLRIKGDLKNWLAWFAFEETAFRMAREDLGLDL